MTSPSRAAAPTESGSPPIGRGTILVSPAGQVRILRSRAADGLGWNCADGAAISDEEAGDPTRWSAYTSEQLAAALTLAADVLEISGEKELAGGLATWDACSGRPCVLPKLAKVVNRDGRPDRTRADGWLAAVD